MKIIKQAHLRDVLNALEKEEITFSRAAELLNEIAVEAVHQALDEAAEEAVKYASPVNRIVHVHRDVLRANILKLKEKYQNKTELEKL